MSINIVYIFNARNKLCPIRLNNHRHNSSYYFVDIFAHEQQLLLLLAYYYHYHYYAYYYYVAYQKTNEVDFNTYFFVAVYIVVFRLRWLLGPNTVDEGS